MYIMNPNNIVKILCFKETKTKYKWEPEKEIEVKDWVTTWLLFKNEVKRIKKEGGRYIDPDGYYLLQTPKGTFERDGELWFKPKIILYFVDRSSTLEKYYETYEEVTEKANFILGLNPNLKLIFDYADNYISNDI